MNAISDDDVSIDELQKAVEHMHGVPARFIEAVEVDERFNGEIVWQGAVKVFALTGHPSGATKAYAWSFRTEGTKRKFKVVLGVRDYRNFLRATFSTANAQLADFGLAPPRARSPLSSEKRVAAAAKMRATRAARGTTSKKQKLAIKGDVTGVLVTPITAAGPLVTADRRAGGTRSGFHAGSTCSGRVAPGGALKQ